MGNPLTLLGLGAGLMYYLDPDRGRSRRARVRDQLVHTLYELDEAIEVGMRDLRNRSCGVTAEVESLFARDDASDEVIAARVRSKLGRFVSHPRAIQVTSHGGRVTLRGPILADEVDHLLAALRRVRGVTDVENQLDIHQEAGHISALQGGRPRTGERPELLQATWSPATRLLVGVAGGVLALQLARRGGLAGLALGALGVGLAARSFSQSSGRRTQPSGGHQPTQWRVDLVGLGSTSPTATPTPPHDAAEPTPAPQVSQPGDGL